MMLVMKVTLAVVLIVFVVALIRKARIASLWRMWFEAKASAEMVSGLLVMHCTRTLEWKSYPTARQTRETPTGA